MALMYKKVRRKVLAGEDAGKVKTYAMAKARGYSDMERLCELVSMRSAMSSADVKSILDSLNWAIGFELKVGNIVQVGEFGNFRLSLSSEGTEKEEDFSGHMIKKSRIIFSPGKSLRRTNNEMGFESIDATVKKQTGEENEDENPESF